MVFFFNQTHLFLYYSKIIAIKKFCQSDSLLSSVFGCNLFLREHSSKNGNLALCAYIIKQNFAFTCKRGVLLNCNLCAPGILCFKNFFGFLRDTNKRYEQLAFKLFL